MLKHISTLSFRKKLISVCALTVVIALVIVGILTYSSDSSNKKINITAVKNYENTNNCSSGALSSLSREEPTTSNVTGSIALLSYKAVCLDEQEKYSQAISDYKQLKNYYDIRHDSADAAFVESEINADYYDMDHPVKYTPSSKPSDDSPSPALINSLNQLRGKQ